MKCCNSKTKAGQPCRAPAGSGGLCFFHANPDKARVLGQVGGSKNRPQLPEPLVAGSMSAADLRDILVEAIRDIRSKKITPRTAGALSQLCNSLHRVLQTADLEARLARLEEQLRGRVNRTRMDADPVRSRSLDESGGETDTEPGDGHTPMSMGHGDAVDERGEGAGEDGSS